MAEKHGTPQRETWREWPHQAEPDLPASRADVAALAAFLDLPAPLAEADTAGLRARHCPQCRLLAADPPATMCAHCAAVRCDLCRPEVWQEEWSWVGQMLHLFILSDTPPDDEALTLFRSRLVAAGSAVFGLVRAPDGRLRAKYYAMSLRSLLHGALVDLIAHRFGDQEIPPDTLTGEQVRGIVGNRRRHRDKIRMLARKRQAARLRDEDQLREKDIALALDCTERELRQWLGARKDWSAERSRYWAQLGKEGE